MLNINIERVGHGKFNLTWDDFPDLELELDFNPLVKDLNQGIIVHWQSKPRSEKKKQGRTWGIYSIATDEYFSGLAENIPSFKTERCHLLEIPESKHNSVPTAVIHFPNLKVKKSEGLILIQ